MEQRNVIGLTAADVTEVHALIAAQRRAILQFISVGEHKQRRICLISIKPWACVCLSQHGLLRQAVVVGAFKLNYFTSLALLYPETSGIELGGHLYSKGMLYH